MTVRGPQNELLPEGDLRPTQPVPNVSVESQVEKMGELRAAQNRGARGYRERDDLMVAWALSNTLSRADMAVAIGKVPSRINQIIRATASREAEIKSRELHARGAVHMPR
jgi:hypothetical protein